MFDLAGAQLRLRYAKFFANWYAKDAFPKYIAVEDSEVRRCTNPRMISAIKSGLDFDNIRIDNGYPPMLETYIKMSDYECYSSHLYFSPKDTKIDLCQWILAYMGLCESWRTSVQNAQYFVIKDFFEVEKTLPGYEKKFASIEEGKFN